MAFVPVPNCMEVFLEHQYNGTNGKGFVLHYETSLAPWTLAQAADLAAQLVTWWNTYMKPLVHANTVLERIRMRELTTVNSLVFDTSTGMPIAGTRSGTPTSSNVVLAVKKQTGLAGKSYRGRAYHFGFVITDLSGPNNITLAYSNLVETAWNEATLLVGSVAEYGMVLASKYTAGQPRAVGIMTPVTGMSLVDRRVDTNRDKLPKGTA